MTMPSTQSKGGVSGRGGGNKLKCQSYSRCRRFGQVNLSFGMISVLNSILETGLLRGSSDETDRRLFFDQVGKTQAS